MSGRHTASLPYRTRWQSLTRSGPSAIRFGWELALGIAAVAFLTLFFFAPALVGNTLSNLPPQFSSFPQADQALFQNPYVVFLTRASRVGIVPLWNPFSLGGVSVIGNGQGTLYPVRILLGLLTAPTVNHDLLLAIHLFAGGLFMFLFLKELRLRWPAALLGAAGWMFSSFNTVWMQDEVALALTALLPAAFLLIHRGSRTRSWRTAAAAGIPLGLMAMGAQLSLVPVAFAVCGTYSAALALVPTRRRFRLRQFEWRRLADPVLTLGIGSGLAAVILVPTALNASQGGRTPVPYSLFASARTIPVGYFEHVLGQNLHAGPSFTSSAFVGLVPLLLAFVGFVQRRPGAALGRWLAVGMFLFAIGAPLVTWLAYHFIPGISRLNSTGYELWAFDFGVILLGAVGLDALLDWSARMVRRVRRFDPHWSVLAVTTLLGLLAVSATAWQLIDFAHDVNPPFTPRREVERLFSPGASAVQKDRDRRSPARPQRVIGFDEFPANVSLIYAVEAANGYDSIGSRRVRTLWEVVGGMSVDAALQAQQRLANAGAGSFITLFEPQTTRMVLLPRLGITTVIASPQDPVEPTKVAPLHLKTIYSDPSVAVFDIDPNPPRAWIVHEAEIVPDAAASLRRFAEPNFSYRTRMVVEPDAGLGAAGQVRDRGSGAGVVANRDVAGINNTSFTVETHSPGWLVMADMYAPGWQVTVNGHDAKLLRADYTLRAVAVSGGRSHLVLTYRPPGFVPGLVITLLALLALGHISVLSLRARRHRLGRRGRSQPVT
jgi:hypothetical protein